MTELISYAYAVARDAGGSLAEALAGLPGSRTHRCIWSGPGSAVTWWSP